MEEAEIPTKIVNYCKLLLSELVGKWRPNINGMFLKLLSIECLQYSTIEVKLSKFNKSNSNLIFIYSTHMQTFKYLLLVYLFKNKTNQY